MRETLTLSFELAEPAELVSSWGLPSWSDPGGARPAIRRGGYLAHQSWVCLGLSGSVSADPVARWPRAGGR
jgi:hypothetical protein